SQRPRHGAVGPGVSPDGLARCPRMRRMLWIFALGSLPSVSHAQFATPPDSEVFVPHSPPEAATVSSSTRLHVGPSLDLVHGDPGFHAALDVGRRNAGLRVATSFTALGTDGGTAIYAGELWLCPAELARFRPIVAAGAGYRDVSRAASSGGVE